MKVVTITYKGLQFRRNASGTYSVKSGNYKKVVKTLKSAVAWLYQMADNNTIGDTMANKIYQKMYA